MGISAHEVSLEQLADEIAQVYERCGFDRDATVSTLQMLTNIEVSTHHAICCALYNVLEGCCPQAVCLSRQPVNWGGRGRQGAVGAKHSVQAPS